MRHAKTIAILVIVVLAAIVVLQNTQTVQTRLLFLTVSMPRALLLFVTFMVGFGLGVLVTIAASRRPRPPVPGTGDPS